MKSFTCLRFLEMNMSGQPISKFLYIVQSWDNKTNSCMFPCENVHSVLVCQLVFAACLTGYSRNVCALLCLFIVDSKTASLSVYFP